MTKYWLKDDNSLHSTWPDYVESVEGAVEFTMVAPADGNQIFNGEAWEYAIEILISNVRESIYDAMHARIEQGIRWAWSAEEDEYSIKLDPGMRELLAGWHQLLTQPAPELNPHAGFVKSNGVIFRAPGNADIPDAAIVEIANFAGLWVPKISQIAIGEETTLESMSAAQLLAFDAEQIDWAIRDVTIGEITITDWPAEKTDWSNDLCLYNP